jgi:hypothetical protein
VEGSVAAPAAAFGCAALALKPHPKTRARHASPPTSQCARAPTPRKRRRRFVLDLITTVPWDWIVLTATGVNPTSMLGRYLALLSLLKLGRMCVPVCVWLWFGLGSGSGSARTHSLLLCCCVWRACPHPLQHWSQCGAQSTHTHTLRRPHTTHSTRHAPRATKRRRYRIVIMFYNISYNLSVGLLALTLMRNFTVRAAARCSVRARRRRSTSVEGLGGAARLALTTHVHTTHRRHANLSPTMTHTPTHTHTQFCFYLLHWAACCFWYIALQEELGCATHDR